MAIIVRVALLLATTVVTLSTLASSVDAQVFRRLRDNIRANIIQQPRPNPVAPPQAQRPQGPFQVAPQPNPQYGQQLTPYSKLTPTQRQPVAKTNANVPQATKTPQAANAIASTNQPATTQVRIVTYYDPRTGRTFQRRFAVDPASNANANPPIQTRQLATRETALQQGRRVQVDRIPAAAVPRRQVGSSVLTQSNTQQPRFNIPPIASPQPANAQINQSPIGESLLPVLAGPSIVAANPATDNNGFSSSTIQSPQVAAPLSAQVQSSSPVVTPEDVRIDTSVAPASSTSADNLPIEISSASSVESSDNSPVVFSVLEKEDDAATENIEIEMNGNEDVDAFFGN